MKRFTETEKWNDPWFRKLTPGQKLVWFYLCDRCDNAGVIDLDREMGEFLIGHAVKWDDILESFGHRIEILENGKLWITTFLEFQVGELSSDCKPHQHINRLLLKHGISSRVSKGYSKGIHTHKEKDKDKEEDKEKEKEKEGGVAVSEREEKFKTLLGALYHRRKSTSWDEKELKQLRVILKRFEADSELGEIIEYYIAKGKTQDAKYLRQDLQTLLNNWSGEIDRARKWKPNGSKHDYNKNPTHPAFQNEVAQ